jgi:adenylate kinase
MKYLFLLVVFFQGVLLQAGSHFVLVGSPGAGKGTFCEWLVDSQGYYQICPGALLRAEAANNTQVGQKIRADVESGKFISPAIVWEVVLKHLEEALIQEKSFVLDGFPKNQECLDLFISFVESRDLPVEFLYFYADEETCFNRMITRLECHQCGNTFNSVSKQPKIEGICDSCQNVLVQRKGDDPQTVRYRLEDYYQNILPVIERIRDLYPVVEVNTSQLTLEESGSLYERLYTN